MGSGECVSTLQTSTKPAQKILYLLPNIDALVDNALGCRLLNFLDAFSGYN